MESCDIVLLSENITNHCDNILPTDVDVDCDSMCIQTLLDSLFNCYYIWINIGLYNDIVELLSPCLYITDN